MTVKRYFVDKGQEHNLLDGRPRDANIRRYTVAVNKGKTYPVRSVKRGGAPKQEVVANDKG